ncbi:unnamed protein product [Clonostachys rosea f. rosea IK726]|uniref:Uncharacterized protein n=2 Tax=Bionectria ochroleuca TaxID=29856 RepID=A0A0B7K375_BIOOC|nr:unnamed protein product [Clonostachys rosea f. rosea IK726]
MLVKQNFQGSISYTHILRRYLPNVKAVGSLIEIYVHNYIAYRPEGVVGLNEKRPGYYIGLVNAAREKSITPGKAGG